MASCCSVALGSVRSALAQRMTVDRVGVVATKKLAAGAELAVDIRTLESTNLLRPIKTVQDFLLRRSVWLHDRHITLVADHSYDMPLFAPVGTVQQQLDDLGSSSAAKPSQPGAASQDNKTVPSSILFAFRDPFPLSLPCGQPEVPKHVAQAKLCCPVCGAPNECVVAKKQCGEELDDDVCWCGTKVFPPALIQEVKVLCGASAEGRCLCKACVTAFTNFGTVKNRLVVVPPPSATAIKTHVPKKPAGNTHLLVPGFWKGFRDRLREYDETSSSHANAVILLDTDSATKPHIKILKDVKEGEEISTSYGKAWWVEHVATRVFLASESLRPLRWIESLFVDAAHDLHQPFPELVVWSKGTRRLLMNFVTRRRASSSAICADALRRSVLHRQFATELLHSQNLSLKDVRGGVVRDLIAHNEAP